MIRAEVEASETDSFSNSTDFGLEHAENLIAEKAPIFGLSDEDGEELISARSRSEALEGDSSFDHDDLNDSLPSKGTPIKRMMT